MNKSVKHFFGIVILLLALYQCKAKKPLIKKDSPLIQYSNIKADSIAKKVLENNFVFEDLKAKINTRYKSRENKNLRFGTFLKMKKDSIIYATISAFNIPVFVAYITPDSITLLNKREKTYFSGEFSYLSTILKTEISFTQLQDLLVGNPLKMDSSLDYYLIHEDKDFYISTNSEINSINDYSGKQEDLKIRYWINELYKPGRTIVYSKLENTMINLFQADYNKVSNQNFPNRTKLGIVSPKDSVNISLNYQRVKINSGVSFDFSIPSNYTKIAKP